jgi:hypothetical protein
MVLEVIFVQEHVNFIAPAKFCQFLNNAEARTLDKTTRAKAHHARCLSFQSYIIQFVRPIARERKLPFQTKSCVLNSHEFKPNREN